MQLNASDSAQVTVVIYKQHGEVQIIKSNIVVNISLNCEKVQCIRPLQVRQNQAFSQDFPSVSRTLRETSRCIHHTGPTSSSHCLDRK